MNIRILGAPLRYVQGPGAIDRLAGELAIIGEGPVAVVIDPVARKLVGKRILQQVPDARLLDFGGECTAAEITERAEDARGAKVLIGVGGGKAIDTAKGAAIELGLPVAIVPTIASNDSPTSHIAVVYTADHAVEGVRHMKTNPALVLVDTAVIAAAPRRFLAAGIGDAMSKPYELAGALAGGGLNFFSGRPTELTQAIVERTRQVLLADSASAMAASAPDAAFERVVEATVLLSGLAFESGGLSIAHSMVRGFSIMPQLSELLHGEMVALGTLTQLAAGQGTCKEIRELSAFFEGLGLPTSFEAFGITEDAALKRMAEVALSAPYASNYQKKLDVGDLMRAMRMLDERS